MTSEYELGCANCGGTLARREVSPESLGVTATAPVEVAECHDCGGRYVPETTLERLDAGGAERGV